MVERCPDKTEVEGPIPSTLTIGELALRRSKAEATPPPAIISVKVKQIHFLCFLKKLLCMANMWIRISFFLLAKMCICEAFRCLPFLDLDSLAKAMALKESSTRIS